MTDTSYTFPYQGNTIGGDTHNTVPIPRCISCGCVIGVQRYVGMVGPLCKVCAERAS